MAIVPGLPVRDGFRLRGTSVSRLETFVDAAFAFGVTMLVVSVGSVPRTFEELRLALHFVPVFAVCFLLLVTLWWAHDLWSRRFGIEDGNTASLSLLFVFVMLIWIYPLRLVFTGAMSLFTGEWVPFPHEPSVDPGGDLQLCFRVYGVGFGALNAILWMLNRLALKKKDELELNAVEVIETKRTIGVHAIYVGIATLSILLTFVVRNADSLWAALPGFIYMLIGVALTWHHSRYHRLRASLGKPSG